MRNMGGRKKAKTRRRRSLPQTTAEGDLTGKGLPPLCWDTLATGPGCPRCALPSGGGDSHLHTPHQDAPWAAIPPLQLPRAARSQRGLEEGGRGSCS